MRNFSISRKNSSNDVGGLSSKDRPPSSWSSPTSPAPSDSGGSTPTGSDAPPRKRKPSMAVKSKRRLSAIFNGSSQRERGTSASPAPQGLPSVAPSVPSVNEGSPPVSLISTPAESTTLTAEAGTEANGGANGSAEITAGVAALHTNGTHPLSQSTVPDTREGLAVPPVVSATSTPGASGMSTPSRIQSLYSQWGLDDSDSDDDYAGYGTASEGLSDLEEEPEEEEEDTKQPSGRAMPNGHGATAVVGTGAAAGIVGAANPLQSSDSGPKVKRSAAPAAKVDNRDFKRGNPLGINQAEALAPDLDVCREVLRLFLTSKMKESEEMLIAADPESNHMYLQSGHSVIQALKGLMTFGSDDLHSALEIAKATTSTATVLRRPTESMFSKLRPGASLQRVRHMSALERHAELVYAETLLVKAIIAIVGGGDWMGLIREAFNMRTAHGIYRSLQIFLEESDKNGFDDDIDMDFRSGVLLGTGTSSLMLSLLPAKVLKLAEVFGYAGDRTVALKTLMSAGGWSEGSDLPAYGEDNEGVRRPICDMILLTFHLVISVLMPVSGVDVPAARKILAYNMRRYPDGIFFLYFQARLHTNECEPELANESLQKALDLELEYVQLQHMCLWDYGCNFFQLGDWNGARQCFDILRRESNWSRAVYTYATAVNVMELVAAGAKVPEATEAEAVALIESLPKLSKKIAGKSLPIEKLANRKGRKYIAQGHMLFLPAMELAYVFGCLGHTPRRVLVSKWLPHINAELERLEASTPEEWGNGQQYWDDYALGHFLRGCVQFTAAYQPPEATAAALAPQEGDPGTATLDAGAEADFLAVVDAAPKVKLDHYILFHNHYEFGRLYSRRGDAANAQAHFDVVMHNKLPVANSHFGKGKYSLEGALQIKTHAAVSALREDEAKGRGGFARGREAEEEKNGKQ
ncbi:hypothetical protein CspeluHIS016_0801590 [Cutaneotrichosporon spelunceum]|uniref:Uncharacterized protein n=1 Tax=Cutaneotrichosporon spelunceum TaxID=1672016 RepID=A0AAD3TZD6_9TREE|nr:hypothetical protein CspeluHIS016_0801590 [Cutaneotrichosporon spelunceum]